MKKILPAMSNLQMAARDTSRDWSTNLGKARKELVAAIREAIVDALPIGNGPTIVKEREEYLAKFDKLFSSD